MPWSTETRTGVRLAVGGNDTVALAWRGTRDWREGRHVHAVVAVRDQWRHPVRLSGKGDVNAPEVVLDVAGVVHVVWPTRGWSPKLRARAWTPSQGWSREIFRDSVHLGHWGYNLGGTTTSAGQAWVTWNEQGLRNGVMTAHQK